MKISSSQSRVSSDRPCFGRGGPSESADWRFPSSVWFGRSLFRGWRGSQIVRKDCLRGRVVFDERRGRSSRRLEVTAFDLHGILMSGGSWACVAVLHLILLLTPPAAGQPGQRKSV